MKNNIFLLLLATLMCLGTRAQSSLHHGSATKAPGQEAIHRIVMQVTTKDTAELTGVMNNLRHLKDGWGDSVQIEVVAHGPGIGLVLSEQSGQVAAIQELMDRGVQFVVCRNTMKQKNITEKQLIKNVTIVPMGVGEIVLKQEQGWSYLKAGF